MEHECSFIQHETVSETGIRSKVFAVIHIQINSDNCFENEQSLLLQRKTSIHLSSLN